MPLTLAQAQALSQSKLTKTVIDEFRKSALMERLIWDDNAKAFDGRSLSYVYNRVTTLPTAAPRLINADYVAQEAATTPITVQLGICGGSFDLDRVLVDNENQAVDLVKMQIDQKTKATVAEYHNEFINGNAGLGTGEFDGLNIFLAGNPNQVIATGVDLDSGADITTNWRTLLDLFRAARAQMDNPPNVWLMNLQMYAVWQSVMDRAGINVQGKETFGQEVKQWDGAAVIALGDIPGTANPIIPTAAGLTSIYGLRIGLDGVHGIAPTGAPLVRAWPPNFTLSGAVQRGAVELVSGLAVKSTRSVVRLDNIDIA